MNLRRTLVAVVTATVVAVGGLVLPAAPAQAAVGVTLTGRGFGHGHGLSQYGAKGRAEAGHTHAQIVAAYYPGTTLTTRSDATTIRVWIQADTDSVTTVRAEAGLTIRTNGAAIALPTSLAGAAPTLWRLRLVSATLVLEGFAGGAWRTHGVPAITTALANQATATFTGSDGTVELERVAGTTYREYAGTVSATRVGTGDAAVVRSVVTSPMGRYLRSVVKAEMPTSWHVQALRAQAVAARTYSTWDKESNVTAGWYDTCDTTSCQVYSGVRTTTNGVATAHEDTRGTAAVDATAGQILTVGGAPIFSQFSASNGGYSSAGSQPYLVAAPDPFDAFPTWTATLDGPTISAKYPGIGGFLGLQVLSRDGLGPWGGRVVQVRISGSLGSVTVTGDAFRSAFGLRSTLWNATAFNQPVAAPQRDWTGDGGADLVGRAPNGDLYLYAGLPGATWARRSLIGKGWNTMRLMTHVHGFAGTNKPEIITTDPAGALYLYPGTGTGGFGRPVRLGQGWNGFSMLVGTEGWQAAGAPGLLARQASTGRLLFYPGNGRGGFGAVRDLGRGWSAYDAIAAAGDWDSDGYPDLVAREAATGALRLFRGDGRGGVLGSAQIGNGWAGMDEIIGAADWDRDGRYDLLARESGTGTLWLYPGDGAGGFLTRREVGVGWVGFSLVK